MAVDATTGRVFVVANSAVGSGYAATVTVLDTTTGQPLRRVVVGNNPDAMGVDEQRGRVVVAGDYRTCLLDARDGTIMRCVTVGNHPRIVLVDARAGHSYLVICDDSIDVVGSGTGATVRSIGLSTCGALMAVALDQGTGRLVVTGGIGQGAAFSGHIQVVDAGSGRVLRSIGIGRPPLVGVTSNGTNRAVILTASYGSDGRNSGDVRLLDMAAGSIRRTATLPAMPLAAALDQRHGHLFVLQADGRLRMLDARRGTILDSR
jgi:DNA-binding beta-propeller fold protein YncE